ncbi:MAG: GIY-YIG nuclease family protein [Pirellulaceae bacterium]|nr:GIY-YIG nuclease family protein [Pirellulaceae bacterium]
MQLMFLHAVGRLGLISSAVVLVGLFPVCSFAQVAVDAADVISSFDKNADGFSSDEVLINDTLRSRFLADLETDQPLGREQERAALLKLLQLRKAGKLTSRTTKRGPRVDAAVAPIAEIAARVVADRHQVTTDTILADPLLRAELQREAEKIDRDVDPYAVRKTVLNLRKKRALKPELVLRVANWERNIRTVTLDELRRLLQSDDTLRRPGIYLFRSEAGYLYIGEASNLSQRLTTHLKESDRPSLAQYLAGENAETITVELHLFPIDSPAKNVTVRRAYESELIRSRLPIFNVRP